MGHVRWELVHLQREPGGRGDRGDVGDSQFSKTWARYLKEFVIVRGNPITLNFACHVLNLVYIQSTTDSSGDLG